MMTPDQLKWLEGATRIGKMVRHKNKGGPGHQAVGKVVDEVYIIVNDYKQMIQQIEFAPGSEWGGNRYAYRAGYYTYDANMKKRTWGQYTPVLTESQYRELLQKAKQKGWGIF